MAERAAPILSDWPALLVGRPSHGRRRCHYIGYWTSLDRYLFFRGSQSDTRVYEKQLTEKDGLGREARDDLSCAYNEVLKERQQLLKDIDICKANMRFDLGDRQYCSDRKGLQEMQQELDLVNAQLIGFERELCTHQGV